ncbi:PhnB protein [Microbacterium resistens]|uniref:PhnB protein n=1 Tax=Microbacterium resistens TaxID=156977 RepID=A0ABU1SBL3_9MICO|nr:VOC family protein [Microbacterium resistens]MDR6866643.1 PhnB protein [Microbacterium resistens]
MPSLNPYLSFRDNARAAMEFYQQALGGELDVSTFEAFPDMIQDPGEKDLVMHAQLTTPDGLVLMASDIPSVMPYVAPQGISVSLSGTDTVALQDAWTKLSDGGTVTMPFVEAPWGGLFGMFTDRFGIDWMISAGQD